MGAAHTRSTGGGVKTEMVVEKNEATGKDLVHRDVFATTKDKVVNAKSTVDRGGESFGIHGTYEQHLQTSHYDDIYSDDEGNDVPGTKGNT